MNCATGPAEMTEHLRYLAQHARTFLSCLPERGAAVGRRRAHALRPHARRARRRARALRRPSSASTSSAAAAAPRPRTCARSSSASARPRARRRARPSSSPAARRSTRHVPFHQELAYLAVGERTNANGSRKFRDAMLEADWDTCVQMAREQVKEGAHVLDVCVDYVGRDGTVDMDEIASRFATQACAAARVRLHRAAGARGRPPALRRQGDPQLGQPRGGRGRGQALRPRVLARARVRRRGHLPHHRRGGPGARRRLEAAGRKRIYDLAIERYGIDPTDLIFDCSRSRSRTGDEDLRRDGMETIEAIRRIKAELPGASTILGLSNVSFGLKPAARHVLNSVFLHECREAGLDAAIVHAARIMPMHKIDDHAREVALDLDLRPPPRRLRPAHRVHGAVRGRRRRRGRARGPLRLAGRGAAQAPHHRRRPRRPRGRPRRAARDAARALDHQRRAARGHEGRRRPLRPRRDAAAVRAAERGDDEDRGRATSSRTWRRPTPAARARVVLGTVKGDVHDIGKNLVDIILTNNGYRSTTSASRRRCRRSSTRRTRSSADAIGMSGLLVKSTLIMRENLQELNERGLADTSRCCSAAPRSRATTSSVDLREVYDGRALLRQGRVRGPAHDGHAHGGQEARHARPRLRPRRRRPRRCRRAAASSSTPADRRAAGALRRRRSTCRSSHRRSSAHASPRASRSTRSPAYINETALFRNQWQFRPDKTRGETDDEFKARIRPTLRAELDDRQGRGLARARGGVGLLPGQHRRQRPRRVDRRRPRTQEWLRFTFPRQRKATVPLHLRLLPAGRDAATPTTRRSTSSRGRARPASASRSCSPRTSTRSTCSCTGCRSR